MDCRVLLLLLLSVYLAESKVKLNNNKYNGIVIAINPEVPEDYRIVDAIKSAWTDASRDLFVATKKRAYFNKITILVPTTWKNKTYQPSDGETYKKADVLIAYENPSHGNVPYTLQYGECGEPGSYIHMTPDYLLDSSYIYDYGPRGKTIVHEWAHYRWGVFDEVATDGYDPFYISYAGKAEANRCPVTVQGDNYYVDWSSQTYRTCDIDQQTFLPEDGCVFVPDESSSAAYASMMSYQYLDSIITFCHDDTSDPANLHNRAAPNEHNRLCSLRSTWDVIRSSTDFRDEANLPNNQEPDTDPEFEVVQPQSYQRFVLVLDTSGSMDENRMLMMRQAASTFLLQSVPTGSEVGMVDFDSTAKTLSEMRRIDDYSDRSDLNALLPTEGEGGTSIGSGILKAIEVLEDENKSAKGGILIVLSDGQENEDPTLKDSEAEIIASGVIVNAIVFTKEADPMLEEIATATGGIWYFSDENGANATSSLTDAFITVAKVDDGDLYRETFQIYSSSFTVVPPDQQIGRIVIDKTIGNNTVFTFTWSQYDTPLEVLLMAPSGCNYGTSKVQDRCESGFLATIDSDLKTITFPIDGTAETGTWTYFVNTGDNYQQNVVVTTTSMAADRDVQPIVVESGMGQITAADGEAIVVYAQVSMGFAPVLKADVTARIERPSGGPVTIVLKDKGAAPDVRKNDGIYSRYFTHYNGAGRYSVQVSVAGIEGQTSSSYSSGYSRAAFRVGESNNGQLSLNSNGAQAQPIETNTGNFSRYASAGGFSFNGTSGADTFPPSRIIDLSATQQDLTLAKSGIRLQFTAPGDDYDSGKATGYDIRFGYSSTSHTDLLTNFLGERAINASYVTTGCVASPQEAGSDEVFTIMLPDLPENETVLTISIAVRAFDEEGNVGDISNVETFSYFIEPLVNERESKEEVDAVLIVMIVFVCLTAILLVVVGGLVWKVMRLKKITSKVKKSPPMTMRNAHA